MCTENTSLPPGPPACELQTVKPGGGCVPRPWPCAGIRIVCPTYMQTFYVAFLNKFCVSVFKALNKNRNTHIQLHAVPQTHDGCCNIFFKLLRTPDEFSAMNTGGGRWTTAELSLVLMNRAFGPL